MSHRSFRVMVLILALLFPLASSAQEAPRLSRDWKRIAADGIEVVGDAPEKELRRVLKEISAFRSSVLSLLPELDLSPREPTTLVVFRNYQAFGEFVPRDGRGKKQSGVGGYFNPSADRNFLVLPVFEQREVMYETIFHEYTHYIVSRNYHDVPLWLNEGLADFYSTFEVRNDGRAIIGRPSKSRLTTLRSGVIPPLAKLLSGQSAMRLFENDSQTAMFYAQSWMFVHFMTVSDRGSRAGQISKFLDLMRANQSAADAARGAFGASLDALDREFRIYAQQFTYPAILLPPLEASTVESAPATALTVAEVATLKARLLLEMRGTDSASKYVDEALALAPSSADVQVVRGLLMQQQEQENEAVARMAEAAVAYPNDFAAHYYHGSALLDAERYDDAVRAFQRALDIAPKSHFGWFSLSLAHMGAGRQADSDKALRRAQELYETPQWYSSRAQEAIIQHRDEVVLADTAAFIARVGGGDMAGAYAAFLAVIAARRLNREAEGIRHLDLVMAALPPKSWVLTVAQYMKGAIPDDEFLDRAKDNGQRTEARTYIGFNALRAGKPEIAKGHFTWVRDKGDKNYTEYRLAKEELERMGPGK